MTYSLNMGFTGSSKPPLQQLQSRILFFISLSSIIQAESSALPGQTPPSPSPLVYLQATGWPNFPPDLVCPDPFQNRTEFQLSDCDGIGPEVFKIVERELGLKFDVRTNDETVFANGSYVEASLINIYKGEKYVSVSLYGINQSRLRYVDFLNFIEHRIVFLTCSPRRIFSESLSWPFETRASGVFLLTCAFFPVL